MGAHKRVGLKRFWVPPRREGTILYVGFRRISSVYDLSSEVYFKSQDILENF